MVRVACSVSLLSVVGMSSSLAVSLVTSDPGQHFVSVEAPILPEAVGRQSFQRTLPHASVNPGHRDLQQLGDLTDGEQFGLLRHTCHGGSLCDIRYGEM